MALYWFAVADGLDDEAQDLEDEFCAYGYKKKVELRFFLLRTFPFPVSWSQYVPFTSKKYLCRANTDNNTKIFLPLGTQTVKFQLINAMNADQLVINQDTGTLSVPPDAEDEFIVELLGEHIDLLARQNMRQRLGLWGYSLIMNDWETLPSNYDQYETQLRDLYTAENIAHNKNN
ncbi:hypothetical protein RUND412_001874 [Rhizina undulata]